MSIIYEYRPCYKRFRLLDCQTRACLKELTAEKVEPLRVLDIGCGVGVTGERLKERRIKEVMGVELNKDAYGEAQKHLDKVFLGRSFNLSGIKKCLKVPIKKSIGLYIIFQPQK